MKDLDSVVSPSPSATTLDRLLGQEPDDPTDTMLLERITDCERLIRRLDAVKATAVARLVGQTSPARRGSRRKDSDAAPSTIEPTTLVTAMLGPRLALSPDRAAGMVRASTELVKDLPGIHDLMRSGLLDWIRARLISDLLHYTPEAPAWFRPGCEQWLIIEERVKAVAPSKTYPELKRMIKQLLLGLDPAAANSRHSAAARERSVRVEPLPDGMAGVFGRLPAESGQKMDGVLDAFADARKEDAKANGITEPRTHQQLRADAFAAVWDALAEGVDLPLARDSRHDVPTTPDGLAQEQPHTGAAQDPCPTCGRRELEETLDAHESHQRQDLADFGLSPVPPGRIPAWWTIPSLPRRKGKGPHVVVTLTDTTLLGLDDTPGLLQGHGPIPADLARRLAATPARITLLVLPGAGRPLSEPDSGCAYGRDHDTDEAQRYRFSQSLIDDITARSQECTYPGCLCPASLCDLDHLQPFGKGGVTCVCNVFPACRRHHRMKTFGGWSARLSEPADPFPPGTIVWTDPGGIEHPGLPPDLPGCPNWALPTPVPLPDGDDGIPDLEDAMTSDEREAERLRRWERAAEQDTDRAERRLRADQQAQAWLRQSARSPQAPTELGEPPF
ncbi:DUF222 domain-containing protein [Kineosporia sp. J2-2]|uniref:DUF222 domain-containing protein n=1 Tax=Kineosporia corallincola TaxID=2835133 RepID=A0ABS5TNQ9_9ACTN|nr:HNH endonuclease signature motif containing protein [Kineosporia corallincola]MBT0772463.1 DUF222 domain-containing protein [Kineosporia corallincola]